MVIHMQPIFLLPYGFRSSACLVMPSGFLRQWTFSASFSPGYLNGHWFLIGSLLWAFVADGLQPLIGRLYVHQAFVDYHPELIGGCGGVTLDTTIDNYQLTSIVNLMIAG